MRGTDQDFCRRKNNQPVSAAHAGFSLTPAIYFLCLMDNPYSTAKNAKSAKKIQKKTASLDRVVLNLERKSIDKETLGDLPQW